MQNDLENSIHHTANHPELTCSPQGRSPAVGTTNIQARNKEIRQIRNRTRILRRVPVKTGPADIIKAYQDAYAEHIESRDIAGLLESVIADIHEKRRIYITFTTYNLKKQVDGKPIKLGNITIPSQTGDYSGYIPKVPYNVTHQIIKDALMEYGNITKGEFRCYKDTEVKTGGYDFEIDLLDDKDMPKQIVIEENVLSIVDKDEQKVCTKCYRYGHLTNNCRGGKGKITVAAAEAIKSNKRRIDEAEEELKRKAAKQNEYQLQLKRNPNIRHALKKPGFIRPAAVSGREGLVDVTSYRQPCGGYQHIQIQNDHNHDGVKRELKIEDKYTRCTEKRIEEIITEAQLIDFEFKVYRRSAMYGPGTDICIRVENYIDFGDEHYELLRIVNDTLLPTLENEWKDDDSG